MKKIWLFLFLFILQSVFSDDEWQYYFSGKYLYDMADEGDKIWIAAKGGLVEFDKHTEEMVFYNHPNSSILTNESYTIVIDDKGNKWLGAHVNGLIKFDGSNWYDYNTSNSDIPSDIISDIIIDSKGKMWIETAKGLDIAFILMSNTFIGMEMRYRFKNSSLY